jgi:probable phosphoglycerate mutase
MSHVILIRPGCTDFDEQQRIQGTLDLPLSARGNEQIQQDIAELSQVSLELILTSPCEPARSCAHRIGAALGVTVKELEGLQNLDQGLWQGLNIADIRRKHPKVFKQWQESPETVCPPEGEMLWDVVCRVKKALEKPLKKKQHVAIVVPEPLASVVRCVVRSCPVEAIALFNSPSDGRTWEYLMMNGSTPADGRFARTADSAARPEATAVSIAAPHGDAANEYRRKT